MWAVLTFQAKLPGRMRKKEYVEVEKPGRGNKWMERPGSSGYDIER
jgi:hypothetical protein